MADANPYDYSVTKHHLQPFVNPLENEPFILEMQDSFGELWEFKDHIPTWTFGVSRWKNFIMLRYRVQGTRTFHTWNLNEKVAIIESVRDNYIVIVLRAVDDDGNDTDHSHSIVIDSTKNHARFDLENLMTFLEGFEMETLNSEFEKFGYVPWMHGSAKSDAHRLSRIFQTLDHYACSHVQKKPSIGRRINQLKKAASNSRRELNSAVGGSGSMGPRPSMARSESNKRDAPRTEAEGSSRKRRKTLPGPSTVVDAAIAAASSVSALTTVSTEPTTSTEKIPDFEKIAQVQKEFWEKHGECFLLDMEVKAVSIDQCILAKDQYVIRTLQKDILVDVKRDLITMIDVRQRQKVCLTPVDKNNKLLQRRPENWEEIKDEKFMIINGQHSIFASKDLQTEGCGESRRKELSTWGAFIVWSLDPTKLRSISKFYNMTNHLDHAQPTWGNQIISCRNIWLAYKRPTELNTEASTRKNKANFNLLNYKSFSDAVTERFQNINPDKDGASIKSATDLKNELQIITLPDDIWAYWSTFLTLHSDGELMDPVTMTLFKNCKGFKSKAGSLKREFFKRFGWFTDKDFKVLAQHLLGQTPDRKADYPKVSISRTKILVPDNLASADWVERRKRKKVVLQDIMAIKPSLKFLDSGGDVIDSEWKPWKVRHRFTSATWDFLLTNPGAEYFKKRLRNDAWRKRARDLQKQFPEVLHMFTRFMTLKYRLPEHAGGVKMRGLDFTAKALVSSTHYKYTPRSVNLAVLDARVIPRSTVTDTKSAIDPFMDFLYEHLEPKMTEPSIWLFLLSGKEDVNAARNFAARELPDYESQLSTYVPSKAEMLNNVTNRGIAADVTLLFLFKNQSEFATGARKCVKKKYDTPASCVYYNDTSKNTEAKWRIDSTELRMEFYFQVLHACAEPNENVLGIYTGAKFLLAAKMFGAYYYGFVDRENVRGDMKLVPLARRMDQNDFMFSNSPYSFLYERPMSRGPIVVHSDSPPSPQMTLESPMETVVVVDRQAESMGAHVSADPGIDGIDQFGTNTFRIRSLMHSERLPSEVLPQLENEDVEAEAVLESQRAEQSQCRYEDSETDTESENQRVEPTPRGDEEIETDTEFDNQPLDQSHQVQEAVANNVVEEIMLKVVEDATHEAMEEPAHQVEDSRGEDDVTITKANIDPKVDAKDIIILSDDDEMDHHHSSDDDDNEDLPPPDMKVVTAPSGAKVKVEKDWWRLDMEARERRIKRQKERDEKDRKLAEAQESIRAANEKVAQIQSQSEEKFILLQSQMQLLLKQAGLSTQSCPVATPSFTIPQPPLPSNNSHVMQVVKHSSAVTPDCLLEDTGDAVSIADVDHVASVSQKPLVSSPKARASKGYAVKTAAAATLALAGQYRRVDDTIVEQSRQSPASKTLEKVINSSSQVDPLVLQLSPSAVERVDYEVGSEDLEVTDNETPPPPKVPPQDPLKADQDVNTRH